MRYLILYATCHFICGFGICCTVTDVHWSVESLEEIPLVCSLWDLEKREHVPSGPFKAVDELGFTCRVWSLQVSSTRRI